MRNKKLILSLFACLSLFAIGLFVLPNIGLAQATDSLQTVGETTGLGATDIRLVVARIIRAGLGLLGIVATCIIIYAGYLWMTAGGNAERVDKAKRLLINALIGLIIIFASVAIVQFVIGAVMRTAGGGGGDVSGGCSDCFGGDATIGFVVENFAPQTVGDKPLPIRNVVARAFFSRTVDVASLDNQIQVFDANLATEIPFTYELSGRTVKIIPKEACPAPNEDRFCYPANTKVKVQILEGIKSTTGSKLQCSSGAYPCEFYFTTGELVDTEPPTIEITDPYNGKRFLKANPLPIQVHVTDDAMVSGADFFVEDELFATESPVGLAVDAILGTFWDATLFVDNRSYNLTSTAYDIADNSATDAVMVHINPAHCGDGRQSEDETGIDCGGSCGACVSAYCDGDLDCAVGSHCVDNKCTAVPEITDVSPGGGMIGSYVLIMGTSFGFTQGDVFFQGDEGLLRAKIVECSDGWSDDSVLVEVPVGAIDGPILLRTSSGAEDATNTGFGPSITDFDVNEVARPNLCRISPRTGQPRERVSVIGRDLGAEQGSGFVLFDREGPLSFAAVQPSTYESWANDQIEIPVPALSEADYFVTVTQDGVTSNPVPFYLRFAEDADTATVPRIDSIQPNNGAVGAYITVSGSNFGDSLGQIWFESKTDSSARAFGAIDFPAACAVEDIWRTDQVIVKVPAKYTNGSSVIPGDFSVTVQRQDSVKSSPIDFEIITGEPGPGACAIKPSQGLMGDPATVYGERLGASGSVIFPDDASATIGSWSSEKIDITIPQGKSGKVFLRSADGTQSAQGVNFSYGAGVGPAAVAPQLSGYGWRFSTGVIPEVPGIITACTDTQKSAVPNEIFNELVCRNARISVEFTTDMSTSSLQGAGNIVVSKCPTAETCGAGQRIVLPDFHMDLSPTTLGGSARVVTLTPTTGEQRQGTFLLTPDTRYHIEIKGGAGGVLSYGGEAMPENVGWEFVTGDASDICALEDVLVQPATAVISVEGGEKGFLAGGYARRCIQLSDVFDWEWNSDAWVATNKACSPLPDSDPKSCRIAVAVGDGNTDMTAREPLSGRTSSADLTVTFSDPYVEATWPSCEDACINAAVGGRFNIPMKTSGDYSLLRPGTVNVAECANELCINPTWVPGVTTTCVGGTISMPDGEQGCRQFQLNGLTLKANTFYKAGINGRVRSTSDKPLTRLTEPGGYTWVFSTSETDQVCAIDSILVNPGAAIATEVGGRQTFSAEPLSEPDHCSVSGQRLNPDGYSWNWEKPDAKDLVAHWIKPGGDFFHATPNGIVGCTTNCLPTGSWAQNAVCGNGVLEAAFEECEDGNLTNNDGCSSSCVREGRDKVSGLAGTCGDGVLNTSSVALGFVGEECDDTNAVAGDGCSATCQNEGSVYAGVVCGNGDLAYSQKAGGEDCDDANRTNGDGCSSSCIHEGSASRIENPAVCGDGIIQKPYETCDDDNVNDGDGCSSNCVREGATADAYRTLCGNGVRDVDFTDLVAETGGTGAGEDCDGGEGCSRACIFEGSSLGYNEPSICGDGVTGKGEVRACETVGTPGTYSANISATQIAEISGTAPAQIATDATRAVADVLVQAEGYESERGDAEFALQCGAVTDDDCRDSNTQGVGIGGCCAARPNIISHAPHGVDVCRNMLPNFVVDTEIDAESARKNTYITYDGTDECSSLPSGHTSVARIEDRQLRPLLAFGRRVFRMIVPVINAQAVGDCVVPIQTVVQQKDGDVYRVDLVTGVLLAPEAQYSFSIHNDHTPLDLSVDGLKSKLGVRMKNDYAPAGDDGTFKTGSEICEVDFVKVTDPAGDPEGFFAISGVDGQREFKATAYALTAGAELALQPIDQVYEWDWTSWVSDDETIATVDPGFTKTEPISTATIIPQKVNGEASLVASLQTSGSAATHVCNGGVNVGKACTIGVATDCPAADGEVVACEGQIVNGVAPISTFFCEAPWPSLDTFPFEDVEGNDDGVFASTAEWTNFGTYYCRDAGKDGVDEDLPGLKVVQPPSLPGITGIQKEFLFEVQDTTEKVFRGDVIGLRVISNPAYLSAGEWYASQLFEGTPQSLKVDGFDAVRDGRTVYISSARRKNNVLRPDIYILSYNQNASAETVDIFEQMITNFKLLADFSGSSPKICRAPSALVDGKTCVSDIDCGFAGVCMDTESKIVRDMQRLTDLNRYARSIESYAAQHGTCSATTTKSCVVSADCPQAEVCLPKIPDVKAGTYVPGIVASTWPSWQQILGAEIAGLGIDPINAYVKGPLGVTSCPAKNATCFDEPSRKYTCEEGSRVYHFTTQTGSADKKYNLVASLEHKGERWEYPVPAYSLGTVIFNIDPSVPGTPASGFVKDPQYCTGGARGTSAICGDGVIGSLEVCELGDVRTNPGCTTADGQPGRIAQRCAGTCRAFEDQPGAVCVPLACNNGIIDPGEECDDGVDNGRYGFCSTTCSYTDAPRCGDNELDAGEACDCGVGAGTDVHGIASGGQACAAGIYNGAYSSISGQSCAWDCRGPAQYCGDLVVNGGNEVCDGNITVVTPNLCAAARVCQAGDAAKNGFVCEADTDCGSIVNGINQGDGQCSPGLVERVRTQSCGAPSSATACLLGPESPCMPATTCGNGSVEGGEDCDDGNRENGDACTNVCRLNVCGDRMVFQGVEACDNGTENGTVCDAQYDANCTYCASNCTLVGRSGAYCGDGQRQQPAELCDGDQMPLQRVSIDGVVGGTCEISQLHNPSTIQGVDAQCEYVGLCDGGDRNGKACIFEQSPGGDFAGLSCGAGNCIPPQCKADCVGMCPFNYDTQGLAFTGQFEGASREDSITLIKEDLFSTQEDGFTELQHTFAAARVNVIVPACRQMGSWVGSVDFSEGPQKTYVMFVNDLSGSMDDRIIDTVTGDDSMDVLKLLLGNSINSLFHELGPNVEIGLIGYGMNNRDVISHSASLNEDIDGDGVLEKNQEIPIDYAAGMTWKDLVPLAGSVFEHGEVAYVDGGSHPDFFLSQSQKSTLTDVINTYRVTGATQTSMGMVSALYAHQRNKIEDEAYTDNARRIVVLMTDGAFSVNYSPSYASCAMQKLGIEVYTFNLGTSTQATINPVVADCTDFDYEATGVMNNYLDWRSDLGSLAVTGSCRELIGREMMSVGDITGQNNNMACISSGNPGGAFNFDYAYSGDDENDFTAAYESILASIIGAQATYIIPDPTREGLFKESMVDIKEGSNIEIPLPEGFSCTNEEQIIPLTINYAREGTITLSNVRANMCKQ